MTVSRRHRLRTAVTGLCLALLVLHVLGVLPLPALNRLDDLIHDARLRATMEQTHDERIVIVDIDEKSLAEVGRWPWPRDRVADLMDRLFDQQGVSLLGLDTVFAEPDPVPGNDARLAQALRGRAVVAGYYFTSDRDGHTSGSLPAPVLRMTDLAGRSPALTTWSGYGASLPVLAQATPLAGFFNAITDADGVVRALPLLAIHGGNIHESLVLAMYRHTLGMPAVKAVFPDGAGADYPALQGLRLQGAGVDVRIPLDGRGAALVPFRGAGGPGAGAFTYVSASDVLAGRLPAGSLNGRIALLGTTAPGLQDLRATPVGQTYPGVEVHASLLSGLLDGRWLVRPDYAAGYELLALLLMGVFLMVILPRIGAVSGMVLCGTLLIGLVVLHHVLYVAYGLVLPQAAVLLLIVTAFAANMSLGYVAESRAKRALAQRFGTYVPPEIVQEMLRDPDRYDMTATTRELTVLFCDMKGFTALSERMAPQQVQAMLNAVFSRLSAVVRRHRGTIDKYMGDCLMAFWGAPLPAADHAERAVQAALDIVAEVEAINREHAEQGLPAIGVGVGLSSGEMCVGDMGSDLRRSYTVIGDAVNLGARLEGLSRVYGVDVVASDRTRELVPAMAWQEIDRVRVKGKAQTVAIHLPLGPEVGLAAGVRDELSQWRAFRQAWLARDWDRCGDQLDRLRSQNAKKVLYQHWSHKVALAKSSPPGPDWDGATDFDNK
jgi:adenylate cyclase